MSAGIQFTHQEVSELRRWEARRSTTIAYFGFFAAIFLPLFAFAVYGVLKQDWLAVSIAFGGSLIVQTWRMATDMSRLALYQSMARKVLAIVDAAAQKDFDR